MKKVGLVRQTIVTECGVCSLAMVAAYYGYKKTISFYRNAFSVGRDGTTVKELYDMFVSMGMAANVYKCPQIENFDCKRGIPYIIYCKENHYAVLQFTGHSYILSDPATEQTHVSASVINSRYAGIIIEAIPTEKFEKTTEPIGNLRYVRKIIIENIRLLLLSLLFTVFAYSVALIVPICLQYIIDTLASGESILDFKAIAIGILGLLSSYVLFSFIRNKISVALEVAMSDNVNRSTMLHLLKIPYAFFDNRSTGNILYRLGILDHLRDVIATSFVNVVIDATSTICVFLCLVISFPFLLVPISALFCLIGLYTLLIAGKTIRLQKAELAASESVSSLRTEIVSNMFQIKCLHLENYIWGNYTQLFDIFQKSFSKERWFSAKTSLGYSTISMFAPIFIVLYCYTPNQMVITAGKIVLIYSLLGMFTNSTYDLFGKATTLLQIKSIVFYLNDMLDEQEQSENGDKQISKFEKLQIENVNFSYSKRSNVILKDFNLGVKQGEKIGIVGLTGSGKTTIVKLLTGLYVPTNGRLLINNIPMDEISRDNISRVVAVVPQMPIIFNKNIRDNITLGDSGISDEQIFAALDCACFLKDVVKMPLGLNTYISSQGGNLSGGQIQRLALARALVRAPQLLIMDEATSSLDAATENQIYQNLKSLGITTIVISHRLSTVADADCLYYIVQGETVVSGKHEWLLENNQSYRNLIMQQLNCDTYSEVKEGIL